MKWVTVDDMYTYSKGINSPLLSNYDAVFWQDYTDNFARYDSLFRRMFNSFRYFMQKPLNRCETITEEHIEEITQDFTYEVYNHLMVNAKKYSELFRVNVIDDDGYSIIDNYNVTETLEKETTKTDNDVYGTRTDETTDTIGAKTDTETEQLGQRQDSTTQAIGGRTDSNETVTGEQLNVGTNTIAGFNSVGFENDTEVSDNLGERTDTSETIIGAQNNTGTNTIGSQSNSRSTQYGSHTDTKDFIKGSQTDTHTGSGTEEYTLTKKGNIGVKTATEIMAEHTEFWSMWEFYSYIFKEICSELLLI